MHVHSIKFSKYKASTVWTHKNSKRYFCNLTIIKVFSPGQYFVREVLSPLLHFITFPNSLTYLFCVNWRGNKLRPTGIEPAPPGRTTLTTRLPQWVHRMLTGTRDQPPTRKCGGERTREGSQPHYSHQSKATWEPRDWLTLKAGAIRTRRQLICWWPVTWSEWRVKIGSYKDYLYLFTAIVSLGTITTCGRRKPLTYLVNQTGETARTSRLLRDRHVLVWTPPQVLTEVSCIISK